MSSPQLFVALAALFTAAFASFNAATLNDVSLTRRQIDGASCPRKIEFNTNKLEFGARDIDMEDKKCEGNGLVRLRSFGASVASNESKPIRYFAGRNRDVGSFLAGSVVGGNIVCEAYNLSQGDTLLFLRPNDDVEDVKWKEVFGEETPLSRDRSRSFEMDDDDRYLIVSDRCFFSETEIFDRVCFPADASVRLQDGSVRTVSQLSIGDHVQVSHAKFSPVFAWTHADAHTKYRFVQLSTPSTSITLTPSHYIYADDVIRPAKSVTLGMKLRLHDGSQQQVIGKKYVWKTGLYNPQTVDGDIVVDGIVATTYTTAVQINAAHALLAPLRAAFLAVKSMWTPFESAHA
ncbi:Warthog protein 8 [Gracilariopsis chorda]|uniref:Warthog protein 8 n=1 Tax=Gracilariopsis chorda TaxID=448386 RepID=A0A2V3IY57_9FLOR|nr:Warthog protein 8 [Gracilariopsis chorda]|eukprot:PXF47051.1 Warthog protein 8 [Gracilariopsis chorda]